MPRPRSIVVALLTSLLAAGNLQAADDIQFEQVTFLDQPLQPQAGQPLLGQPSPNAGEKPPDGELITFEKTVEPGVGASLYDFLGYRYATGGLAWIPGTSADFGIFSIFQDRYIKSGINHDVAVGLGFHSLCGPEQTDMPAWVFDFAIGYQLRQQIGQLKFDLATGVLAASDFKGDSRQGIRFPSHAVGYLSLGPGFDLVFGGDYLDRGDIKFLPVGGFVWVPNASMRFEIVFPRPRVICQITDKHRIYVGGELGGGSWAIERETFDLDSDLATYRDYRVCVGIEDVELNGQRLAFEIGYLFNRRLEYSSGIGDMYLSDAVMLRLITRY